MTSADFGGQPERFPDHLECPLPILRESGCDDALEITYAVEPCGQPVYLQRASTARVDVDGAGPPEWPEQWRVVCGLGHRLFVPDIEEPERDVPYTTAALLEAVAYLDRLNA